MWSGPRTVSTALMRAWENRPGTLVVDEPLCAFYLAETGLDHPGGGLGPVVSADGRVIGDGEVGPVTKQLTEAYLSLTAITGTVVA
jgi:hypothetical protein